MLFPLEETAMSCIPVADEQQARQREFAKEQMVDGAVLELSARFSDMARGQKIRRNADTQSKSLSIGADRGTGTLFFADGRRVSVRLQPCTGTAARLASSRPPDHLPVAAI